MLATTNDIKSILKGTWPRLKHIWPDQRQYWLPSARDVALTVAKYSVRGVGFIKEIRECEWFSSALHFGVRTGMADAAEKLIQGGEKVPESLQHSQSYFYARGVNFPTVPKGEVHRLNGVVTNDMGVLLIEPQTDYIWRPERSKRIKHDNFVFYIGF